MVFGQRAPKMRPMPAIIAEAMRKTDDQRW